MHFFKYSRALGRVTGRRPQEMIRTGAFDAVLPEIVMGSRATARRVAALVTEYVEGGPGVDRVPYLGDLLRYETAMMIADAGPRDWTGNGAAAKVDGRAVPEVVEGTQVVDFGFDLPHVFRELPGAWSEVPVPPRRPLRLLFARSPEGRVAVVRPPGEALRLLEFAGRGRTVEELARRGGFDETTARAGVADLVELGALRFATGS